jgi:hypothetical protein
MSPTDRKGLRNDIKWKAGYRNGYPPGNGEDGCGGIFGAASSRYASALHLERGARR